MLRGLFYFLKLALYWLLFFTLYRLAFILIYPGKIPAGKYSEAMITFLYGLRLDLATIAYLGTVPLMLWAIQQFLKKNILNQINHVYNLAMISAITLLCISNIAMYGERNSLINYTTLYYLLSPAKVFPQLSTLELSAVSIGAAVVIAIFVLLFRIMLLMVIPYSTTTMSRKAVVISGIFPLIFIIMRGGIQRAPIDETASYRSESIFINHVSVNPVWHLSRMTLVAIDKPDSSLTNSRRIK
jgi:hypothetical protein